MFGPAQAAVAKAVADSVDSGVIPKDQAENLVIVCGVFIHWLAEDDKAIYDNNYKATVESIANAMGSKPSVDEMLAGKDAAHPFRGFYLSCKNAILAAQTSRKPPVETGGPACR